MINIKNYFKYKKVAKKEKQSRKDAENRINERNKKIDKQPDVSNTEEEKRNQYFDTILKNEQEQHKSWDKTVTKFANTSKFIQYREQHNASVNSENSPSIDFQSFYPNWLSNKLLLNKNNDRNRAYLSLFDEYNSPICFTKYNPMFLGEIYDSNIIFKKVIDIPVGFAFNNLKITAIFKKNTDTSPQDEQTKADLGENIKSIKQDIINIITTTEIYGNSIYKIEKDNVGHVSLKHEPLFLFRDISEKADDNVFFVASTTRPQNINWRTQIGKGGLSYYDNIMYLLKQIDTTMDASFEALKIKDLKAIKNTQARDVDTGDNLTSGITRAKNDERYKALANNLNNKNLLSLGPSEELLFPNPSGDMSCYQDALCFALEQATGIPASVFRGESLASISIGSQNTDCKPLLQQTIAKFRTNYEELVVRTISYLEQEYQDFNFSFGYTDSTAEEQREKFDGYKSIADLINTLANTTNDENTAELTNLLIGKLKNLL